MQRDSQKVTHKEQKLTKLGLTARLYHSVSDYTSFLQCLAISISQQHGLLHGERLLCVPVVWSSKQLGELLPYDGLLLLELCPVVKQAVRVGGKRELLNWRHLSLLEARRTRHPTWGWKGQLILRCPREPVYRPPRFWQVVRVRLASPMPVKPVVHRGVHLCGGGELLQVDRRGPPFGFQLQGVLRGRPGVTGVVGGARWRLPAVGGEGVVHESLLRGEAVARALGGGVRSFPVRHIGGWGESGGRSIESVLASVVQAHAISRVEDGDFGCSPARGVLLGRSVVLAARVAGLDPSWTVKCRRKRVFGRPGP